MLISENDFFLGSEMSQNDKFLGFHELWRALNTAIYEVPFWSFWQLCSVTICQDVNNSSVFLEFCSTFLLIYIILEFKLFNVSYSMNSFFISNRQRMITYWMKMFPHKEDLFDRFYYVWHFASSLARPVTSSTALLRLFLWCHQLAYFQPLLQLGIPYRI